MRDYSFHSGERISNFDPALLPPDCMARYQHVASRLRERAGPQFGADIFCGSGYGAAMIAEQVDAFVLAIDGSAEAIAAANTRYIRSNLLFSHKTFPFDLPAEGFDFIASIESIEHVRDYDALMQVFASALKPGGQLFLSCPNQQKVALERTGYPWHFKHFLPEELRRLAHTHGFFEQAAYSTSCLIAEQGDVICGYHYQLGNGVLLDEDQGDTLFFEFTRR